MRIPQIRCRECHEVKDWYDFRKHTWDGTAICRYCEDHEYDPEREEERRERLGLDIDPEQEEMRRQDFISLVRWLKERGM